MRADAPTVDALLDCASERRSLCASDSKSGSRLERIVVDGVSYVVKHVHIDHDWTMRCLGDLGPRPYLVWERGLLDALPERIDHTVVAGKRSGRNGWGAVLVMRDVGPWLVPAGDAPLSEVQHLTFLDDCAALCAATWGWADTIGLVPYEMRWTFFGPAMLDVELRRSPVEPVPAVAAEGWARFHERAPKPARDVVDRVRRAPWILADALRTTPSCFIHGDWKLGNLGIGADGRTILLDCTYPGEGPAAHELAWYLSINRSRLPVGHTKEDTIAAFADSLRRHGVDLTGWWERQLALGLLGALVQHGWEKALGDDDELLWWCGRGIDGAQYLA